MGPAVYVHRLDDSGELLKGVKSGGEVKGQAVPSRHGIFGDQITKDALLLTAGPIEALSSTAAETKEAKAAARRLWSLDDNMSWVPL
ncbi:hypothetical protein SPHINGOR109_30102 [Sphingorhabdus sp. 109]|nr:hypothetical protein SPHINGOR109_30102 [Sphingorhabdus sp. 109]